MSSVPKEHDYIGLSGTSMERISDKLSSSSSSSSSTTTTPADEENSKKAETSLNLKETELRLGLPGSHSPERKPLSLPSGVSLFGKDIDTNNNNSVNNCNGYSCSLSGPSKNLVSGAKRGFSDAIIDGSSTGNWIFSATSGSDVDLSNKGAALFSPRNENGCNNNNNNNPTQKSSVPVGLTKKDGVVAAGGVIPQSSKPLAEKNGQVSGANENTSPPASKAQVVGWPPIRSFRKNTMASNVAKNHEDAETKSGSGCLYVKVSMDGAPYLRKVDLKTHSNYAELSSGLEKMFSCFTIGQCGYHGLPGRDGLSETCLKDLLHGSEYVLTYEDKDGDWMLVGDVPWEMFTDTCRRLRIMKGSEAIGLAPRAMEKCKSRN